MRTTFYHNSPHIYDNPSYFELSKKAKAKRRYNNRALGLFASTLRQGIDTYGEQQYRFELALNSTVIEVPFSTLERNASWDYYFGLRRGYMLSGVDAIKSRHDPASADWLLIVLKFEAIKFWDRLRWENAFYQGMMLKQRIALLERSIAGDLEALTAAFCCTLAPMGSCFWLDQYTSLDEGGNLSKLAIDALNDALTVSQEEVV